MQVPCHDDFSYKFFACRILRGIPPILKKTANLRGGRGYFLSLLPFRETFMTALLVHSASRHEISFDSPFGLAQDLGCELPLRSRPQRVSTYNLVSSQWLPLVKPLADAPVRETS